MTVSTPKFLQALFNTTAAMGDKIVSSDAYFEIKGHEEIGMLIKQFPWPVTSVGGEIPVPMPQGGERWQPQQVKINHQGAVQIMETRAGHAQELFKNLIVSGGRFDANIYEGMPSAPLRKAPIYDAFFVMEDPDRDWENRSQIVTISGTLFFHYFGLAGSE